MSGTGKSRRAAAAERPAMSEADFAGLVGGMKDVLAFYQGERKGFRVHTAQDIKAIRARTKLSSRCSPKPSTSTLRRFGTGSRAGASLNGRHRCCSS